MPYAKSVSPFQDSKLVAKKIAPKERQTIGRYGARSAECFALHRLTIFCRHYVTFF